MKPSRTQRFIDRALQLFNLQRRRSAPPAAIQRRGYVGARYNNLTADWSPATTTANMELRRDLRNLRNRSRELARNKGVMKKFLGMLAANVVGAQGISLRITFDTHGNSTPARDLALADEIETAFREWGKPETCSGSGKFSWVGALALAIRTMGRDGEFLCHEIHPPDNPFGYALNFRDVAWLDEGFNMIGTNGNRVLMSVELNQFDRPVRYWLTRPASDYLFAETNQRTGYRTPVSADEIIHKFLITEDEIQTRGVPMCHAAMENIHIAGGHVDAELYASRAGACVMDWLKPPKDADEFGGDEPLPAEFETGAVRELQSAVAQVLPPGWDVSSNDPKHPNTNFADFQKAVKREIASALEVSYHSLANDLEGVNYSSIRAGLIDERDTWRFLQTFMIEHFCHRVFRNWLKAAMVTGAVTLSLRDFDRIRDTWRPRGWDWVDPLKDIQAAILAIDNGLESRTDYCDERGDDFADNVRKLAAEQKAMIEAGLAIPEPSPPPTKPKPTKPTPDQGDGTDATDATGDQESTSDATDGTGDQADRVLPIFESQIMPATARTQ